MLKARVDSFPRDSRELLKSEFARRCARNARYSLRSYARDLGIGASTLTEVMNGRYGLSREKALSVAKRLKLDETGCEHFADLFEAKFHRSPIRRKAATLRIGLKSRPEVTMSLDAFQVISDWYHFAILELICLKTVDASKAGSKSITRLAKSLGLRKNVIEEAIDRLLRVGLIRIEEGHWVPTDDFTAVGNETPSAALVQYHQQLLNKALIALKTQPVQKRNFSNTIFSMDRARLDEAKQDLKKLRLEFAQKYGPGATTPPNDVVCLGMQLFSLLEETEETP